MSEVVVDGGNSFIRSEAAAREASLQVHVADVRKCSAPWSLDVWYLVHLGAKEAGNGHSELRAADGSGVGQNAGSVESRIGEHGFVGCGRIEHMRSVHHHQLRIQILNHIRRVRKRPRWCPPNANWVLVGFDLATVRPRQL